MAPAIRHAIHPNVGSPAMVMVRHFCRFFIGRECARGLATRDVGLVWAVGSAHVPGGCELGLLLQSNWLSICANQTASGPP
jgi:hypothetical protein